MGFVRKALLAWQSDAQPCAACASPLVLDRMRGMALSVPLLLGLPVLVTLMGLGLLRSPMLALALVLTLLWVTAAAWCFGVGLRVRGRYG